MKDDEEKEAWIDRFWNKWARRISFFFDPDPHGCGCMFWMTLGPLVLCLILGLVFDYKQKTPLFEWMWM